MRPIFTGLAAFFCASLLACEGGHSDRDEMTKERIEEHPDNVCQEHFCRAAYDACIENEADSARCGPELASCRSRCEALDPAANSEDAPAGGGSACERNCDEMARECRPVDVLTANELACSIMQLACSDSCG